MKIYDEGLTPRICGDCTDRMMRSPVCAERIAESLCETVPSVCDERHDVCGIADEWSDTPLAIVTAPYQGFGDIFDCPNDALRHGTLFRLLVLPITDAPGPKCRGGYNG